MSSRDEQKTIYQNYRLKAREIFEIHGDGMKSHVFISHFANVQVVGDGAYVEATVWIPKEKLDARS